MGNLASVSRTTCDMEHGLSVEGMASIDLSEGRVTSINLSQRAVTHVSISLCKGGEDSGSACSSKRINDVCVCQS